MNSRIDKRGILERQDGFITVRSTDRHVVCEYNPVTRQIRVVKRNGRMVMATLPEAAGDRPSGPEHSAGI